MQLGGQQLGVDVSGFPAAVRRTAQLGAVKGFAFPEQQVLWLALNLLTALEAEGLRAGTHQRPGGSPPVSLAWM